MWRIRDILYTNRVKHSFNEKRHIVCGLWIQNTHMIPIQFSYNSFCRLNECEKKLIRVIISFSFNCFFDFISCALCYSLYTGIWNGRAWHKTCTGYENEIIIYVLDLYVRFNFLFVHRLMFRKGRCCCHFRKSGRKQF